MIEIKQRCLAISNTSEWELLDYDRTVWQHCGIPGVAPVICASPLPSEYMPGLLSCFIFGERVTLDILDETLRRLSLTRSDVTKQISENR
ncbi:MAG: hypothetical protein Q8S13_11280 [Dehalococcoidia bacterium]|nr:hypothetical protein [Dehalococcoidia bacterium]